MISRSADDDRREGAQVVGRTIDILLAVARLQRTGASMGKITAAVGLNRSTCSRIVRYLAYRSFLEFDEASGNFYIGSLAFELGLAARGAGRMASGWQPRLDRIRDATGMTAYLVTRSDLDIVCLASAEANSIVRAVPLVPGQRLPLGIGAGSLAILSACSDSEVSEVIECNQDRFRAFGERGVYAGEVRKRIEAARRSGYAESIGTVVNGICGLGVMVPASNGYSPLAVSVSSMEAYFLTKGPEHIAQLLMSEISDAGRRTS